MTGSTTSTILRPSAPGREAGDPVSAPAPDGPSEDTPELPSVGVVIPTRNRPELMLRALDAALAQDYAGPLRIIVVFDGTTPDYLLARTEPHPVMVLANWRTPGLAGTRNTGVLGLDTDLVAFCDDDDSWMPNKLRTQVDALLAAPAGTEFVTCAIEVEHEGNVVPRLAGQSSVCLDDLVKSRMSMLHSSTFMVRREAMLGGLGLVAEDAPGSQNEDWDMLLRASKRAPIVHVDEPLVRVLWGTSSHFAYEYATKISSLRWMMSRHPEIRGCRPGAARVYGQLACWSAASGNKRDAWFFTRQAVRNNWREPRAAIAIAAATGVVSVEAVLGALQRRGHGI
jgi:glycosyltransferase involved in cell wall biosynthesis